MHFRCVLNMLKCCVLVGLDWAEPMILLMLYITCSCIFNAYIPSFLLYSYIKLFGAFLFVHFLSLFLLLVALWHLNENPLRPRTLFVSGHLLLLHPLILLHLTSNSVMIKLFGELLTMRYSFEMPSHSIRLFRY